MNILFQVNDILVQDREHVEHKPSKLFRNGKSIADDDANTFGDKSNSEDEDGLIIFDPEEEKKKSWSSSSSSTDGERKFKQELCTAYLFGIQSTLPIPNLNLNQAHSFSSGTDLTGASPINEFRVPFIVYSLQRTLNCVLDSPLIKLVSQYACDVFQDNNTNTGYVSGNGRQLQQQLLQHPLLNEEIATIVEVPFRPSCLVQVPDGWYTGSDKAIPAFLQTLSDKFKFLVKQIEISQEQRSYTHGWIPDPITNGMTPKKWGLWRMSFLSLKAMKQVSKWIEDESSNGKEITIKVSDQYIRPSRNRAALAVFEERHDPTLIFQNAMRIGPSNHVLLTADSYDLVETSWNNVQFPPSRNDILSTQLFGSSNGGSTSNDGKGDTNSLVASVRNCSKHSFSKINHKIKSGWARGIYTSQRPFQVLKYHSPKIACSVIKPTSSTSFASSTSSTSQLVLGSSVFTESTSSEYFKALTTKLDHANNDKSKTVITATLNHYLQHLRSRTYNISSKTWDTLLSGVFGLLEVNSILGNVCKLKTASFDLECYSASGRFPKARNADDVIIMIGTSVCKMGSFSDEKLIAAPKAAVPPQPPKTEASASTVTTSTAKIDKADRTDKVSLADKAEDKKTDLSKKDEKIEPPKPKSKPKTYQEAFALRGKEKKKEKIHYTKEAYERHIFYLRQHPNAKKIQQTKKNELERIRLAEINDPALAESIKSRETIQKLFEMSPEEKKRLEIEDEEEKKKPLILHAYDNELDMIMGWKQWMDAQDPDIITGHNIHKFDFLYLFGRLQKHYGSKLKQFCTFSRFMNLYTPVKEIEFNSGAAGNNSWFKMESFGRLQIDTYTYTKRNIPGLSSWALGSICSNFLGLDKLDVSPFQIFEYFLTSNPELIGRISRYCAVDCDLVLDLLINLKAIPSIISMSRVTFTKFQNILDKGQQEKIYNFMSKLTRDLMYVINYKRPRMTNAKPYAGGEGEGDEQDNETKPGSGPTSINNGNTKIFNPTKINQPFEGLKGSEQVLKASQFSRSNARNSDDHEIRLEREIDEDGDGNDSVGFTRDKVKTAAQRQIEDELKAQAFEAEARGEISLATRLPENKQSCGEASSANAKQESISNAHGHGHESDTDSEEENDRKKRERRKQDSTRKKEKGYAGATVFRPMTGLYSIPVGVLDFTSMYPYAMKSRNLCPSTWVKYPTPEQLDPKANELAKAAGKPWYHVINIYPNTLGEEVKYDRKHGYTYKATVKSNPVIAPGRSKIFTLKRISMPNGPSGPSGPSDGHDKDPNQSGNVDHKITNKPNFDANKPNNSVAPTEVSKPSNGPKSDKTVLKQYCFVGHVKGITDIMLTTCIDERNRVKKELKKYDKSQPEYQLLDLQQNSYKITGNSIYGFNGSGDRGRHPCPAVAECTTAESRHLIETSKNIVESNKFDCEVLYGDTDSIMIRDKKNPNITREEMGKKCEQIADYITNQFEKKATLTYEKIYWPWLLLKKKKYGGMKYDPDGTVKIHTRGLEDVRRDNPQQLRNAISDILYLICTEGSYRLAAEYIRVEIVERFKRLGFTVDDYVTSKTLARTYANPDIMIQLQVANKKAKRLPGSQPPIGDRVPFVMTLTPKCPTVFNPPKQGMRGQRQTAKPGMDKLASQGDDPEYVKRAKIPLDHVYYLNMFRRSCERLFQFSGKYLIDMHRQFDEAQSILLRWSFEQVAKNSVSATNLNRMLSHAPKRKLECIKMAPKPKPVDVTTVGDVDNTDQKFKFCEFDDNDKLNTKRPRFFRY